MPIIRLIAYKLVSFDMYTRPLLLHPRGRFVVQMVGEKVGILYNEEGRI